MTPLYLLTVDEPDERWLVLVVRTGNAGVTSGELRLPACQEIEAGWDGPHTIGIAVSLAVSYAEAYGYQAIAIDIESSQLWDHAWGSLSTPRSDAL